MYKTFFKESIVAYKDETYQEYFIIFQMSIPYYNSLDVFGTFFLTFFLGSGFLSSYLYDIGIHRILQLKRL